MGCLWLSLKLSAHMPVSLRLSLKLSARVSVSLRLSLKLSARMSVSPRLSYVSRLDYQIDLDVNHPVCFSMAFGSGISIIVFCAIWPFAKTIRLVWIILSTRLSVCPFGRPSVHLWHMAVATTMCFGINHFVNSSVGPFVHTLGSWDKIFFNFPSIISSRHRLLLNINCLFLSFIEIKIHDIAPDD